MKWVNEVSNKDPKSTNRQKKRFPSQTNIRAENLMPPPHAATMFDDRSLTSIPTLQSMHILNGPPPSLKFATQSMQVSRPLSTMQSMQSIPSSKSIQAQPINFEDDAKSHLPRLQKQNFTQIVQESNTLKAELLKLGPVWPPKSRISLGNLESIYCSPTSFLTSQHRILKISVVQKVFISYDLNEIKTKRALNKIIRSSYFRSPMKHVFSFLALFCILGAFGLDNGLGLKPPLGWNSYNRFGCNINETIIRATADQLVSSGLASLGYIYLNLDDCWQKSRDLSGRIHEDPESFPSGISNLSAYIHAKGLKFGLYSDSGILTCQARPGSFFFEAQDAATYKEWQVDYLKYDNCYSYGIDVKYRYKRMRDALNASNHSLYFSICEWGVEDPVTWAKDYGNSWRTTQDIKDNWQSILSNLDQTAPIAHLGGPGGWNDLDMLEVGNGGATTSEYEAHFALWSLLKSPLLIGCDITNMSADTQRILMNEEIIALNQDDLGIPGTRRYPSRDQNGTLEVWAGPLTGGRVAVVLLNRMTTSARITATFDLVGYYIKG
eukprot:TRINITY_DN2445_c0_g1_i26.p1 TRINITY_DN2445_c0_g1~~TRINITY_DN2445_c0_g1_i26.p1  ORF type:complete len:550 (+),score=12.78 TRINITY_DN2445_c0_g1_i26:147-1796(+)